MCARSGGFERGPGWAAWAAWCDPEGRPWERPGRRGGRGGRRGRVFDRGDLKYAVLRMLARGPMHGYQVMQALEEESGGMYAASAGSVYPVLQLLQDQGYLTAREEEGRRVYTITAEGRAFLERHTDRADDVMGRFADLAGRVAGREFEELTRTFVRLARASFEGAVRAADDPGAAARVRDVLERAIRDVEGLARADRPRGEGGPHA